MLFPEILKLQISWKKHANKKFNRTKPRQLLWPRPRLNHPNFRRTNSCAAARQRMVYQHGDGAARQGCKQILAIMLRGGGKRLCGTIGHKEKLTDMRLVRHNT